ncbi:minor capsid protein [Cohnella sp. LGH]|uniref:minor capsid protein n=1 Tax=Cohnella sp. LGH TaxID=1619153 RepID=UPI001ADB593E|nr:minor capsid protein [Cohnella sp. LGH]QTH44952.1 minor capsid protein [Cohnella sp. LGH]
MRSEEYWAKRMEAQNEAQLEKGEAYIRKEKAEYDKAMARIKRDTESWYARLAKNNAVSMAEARKLLSASELKEFRWNLDEYREAIIKHGGDPKWRKAIENARARIHISKLDEQKIRMRHEVELLAAKRVKGTTGTMSDIYKNGYYRSVYEVQRGKGKGVPPTQLDKRQIDRVLSKPWAPDGSNFSARIWADRTKLVSELETSLEQHIIRGEPLPTVIKDFSEKMGVSMRTAERLIRTESAYFSGQSRLDGYRESGVERYKYVATMDHRTSEKCQGMNGKVILVSEAKAGVNYPPLHAYCRSTTIPIFGEVEETHEPEEAKELKEPEKAKDKPDDEQPKQEQDPQADDPDSYDVPPDETFSDWAEQHAPDATEKPEAPEPPAAVTPTPVKPVNPSPEPPVPKRVEEPPALTHDEEAAVTRYVGGESYGLNDKLRRGDPLDSNEMQWVENLDRALAKLPTYSGDLSRSLHFASAAALAAFMQDVKPGSVVQYPQYISMTAGALYNPAGQVQFYILGATLGSDIRKMNPGELEVLYGRDFPFKIVNLDFIDGVYFVMLEELVK